MTKQRDRALDGLRGIAAMCVVLSHVAAMTWTPFSEERASTWLEWALWNLGAPAVDVFFVLSGYVIASSLLRRPAPYGEYVLSRLVRLYPIAWMAVCAGLLLRHFDLKPIIGMTSGLQIGQRLDLADVAGFMTFIAPIPMVNKVNAPLWTVVIEMQAALVLPFIVAAARRSIWPVLIGALLLPVLAVQVSGYSYPFYFAGFPVGVALAAAEGRIPKAPRPMTVLVFFVLLLMGRHVIQSDDAMLRVPGAIFAAGIIIAVRQGALRRLLEHRVLQWLGTISYPLYALHWPVMVAAAILFGSTIGIHGAALASIPASLLAALLASRLIDRPAIRLSNLLRGR